ARTCFLVYKHFSKDNEILKNLEKKPINWQLT
ncbi:uracil-DNA glycosylase, partial [Campylobacter coli]